MKTDLGVLVALGETIKKTEKQAKEMYPQINATLKTLQDTVKALTALQQSVQELFYILEGERQ